MNRLLAFSAALVVSLLLGVSASAAPPTPKVVTEFAILNPGTVSLNATMEIVDLAGTPVWTGSQDIAAGSEWAVHLKDIAAIPNGFIGTGAGTCTEPCRIEVRVRPQKVAGLSVKNLTGQAGAFDIRYMQGGVVARSFASIPIGANAVLALDEATYPPPLGYDKIVLAGYSGDDTGLQLVGYYGNRLITVMK